LDKLKGFQKKYLRGLAHSMKPVVLIGQKGCTDTVLSAVNDALNTHELIKVKFIELKDKARKNEILVSVEDKTLGDLATWRREEWGKGQKRDGRIGGDDA